ncbi:hypothetical protein LIER_25930 [Lithospermum erythrorhizon]|uniref:Uncharacterized protein n=1 Tax=Lithospermum erythrorhizon TaxID=34254 RepID=A0AAV3R837_LITER
MFVNKTAVESKKIFKKSWEEKRTFLKYDHCLMKCHTKDNCYELKGYPDNFGNRGQKGRFQNQRNSSADQRSYNSAHAYLAETPVEPVESTDNGQKGDQLMSLM